MVSWEFVAKVVEIARQDQAQVFLLGRDAAEEK
jgi:hypothetical protein